MSYGRYQYRDEEDCTKTCPTQRETRCGGKWRNSVYRRHWNLNIAADSVLGELSTLFNYMHFRLIMYCYNTKLKQRIPKLPLYFFGNNINIYYSQFEFM